MDIQLSPHNVCVARFEEGTEFLGYRIHEYENSAELIELCKDAQFNYRRQQVRDAIRQAPAQQAPAAAEIGGLVKDRLSAGFRLLESLVYLYRPLERKRRDLNH
jgi:hypothetical protein